MICCRPPLDTVWFKRGRSILILLFCTGLWLGTNSSSQSGLLDLVDCPKSDALLRFLRICSNAQGQFSKDNPANVGSFLIGHMMVWFWLILLSKSPCRARTYCPKKTPRILRDDPSSSQPSICANTHSSHIWSHLDHTLYGTHRTARKFRPIRQDGFRFPFIPRCSSNTLQNRLAQNFPPWILR